MKFTGRSFHRSDDWDKVKLGCRVRLEVRDGTATIEGIVTSVARGMSQDNGVSIESLPGSFWDNEYSIQILEEPEPELPTEYGLYVVDNDFTENSGVHRLNVYRLDAFGWTWDGQSQMNMGTNVKDHVLSRLSQGGNARLTRLVREESA